MKKLVLLAFISSLASAPLFAQGNGFIGPGTSATTSTTQTTNGGFKGPMDGFVSVADALKKSDDSRVILQGYIIKQLDDKHYEFKDDSGVITVEIKPTRWQNQTITPKDKIEIIGEIDKDWTSTEVEVKSLRKIAN